VKYVGIALLAVLGAAAALLLAAVIRTLLMPSKKSTYAPAPDLERERLCAEKLSAMVKLPTVSAPDDREGKSFETLHRLLEQLFPRVHESLERTVIDGNLLYLWKGKSSERPVVLMAHQDVVPAEGQWQHDPFSGDIIDGKVWGRGSGDTKCSLMAFFQAAEELLDEGFVPAQDIYFASSCTEEISGDGAPKLVAELKRRGVRPWLVCDEGGGIISEPVGGVKGNYAMVGVFEKGKADVKFTARSGGGHASAPPRNTPVARLAKFVACVEKKSPFRKQMLPEVETMFAGLAPYAGFAMKLLLGNIWLFRPLLKAVMPMVSAQAGAMLRTTIAFTMLSGSEACNVLPQAASVSANLRFIPHQGMEESIEIITKLAEKFGLETEVIHGEDFTRPVDIHGEQWKSVTESVARSFPGLPAVPYVVTGGTDARFFQEICDNCVRFSPVIYEPAQLKGMHGIDETINTSCLPGAVDFYRNLIAYHK